MFCNKCGTQKISLSNGMEYCLKCDKKYMPPELAKELENYENNASNISNVSSSGQQKNKLDAMNNTTVSNNSRKPSIKIDTTKNIKILLNMANDCLVLFLIAAVITFFAIWTCAPINQPIYKIATFVFAMSAFVLRAILIGIATIINEISTHN